MKEKLAQLRDKFSGWFSGLTQREQRLVWLSAGACTLVVVVVTIVASANGLSNKRATIERTADQIAQLRKMSAGYLAKKGDAKHIQAKVERNKVSLFSLLQNVSGQLDLTLNDLQEKKNILPGEKIVEISVKVNLQKLSLDRLTAFVDALEGNPNDLVKVTQLKVKTRFDEPDLLDAQMTVATWKAAS